MDEHRTTAGQPPLRLACDEAPARKSNAKDQRSILAEILRQGEGPLSADEIVEQRGKTGYEDRLLGDLQT